VASKLTNRVVGSLALFAVAVIVLPELLTGKPQQVIDTGAEIPLAPNLAMRGQERLAAGSEQLAQAQQQMAALSTRPSAEELLDMTPQEARSGTAVDDATGAQPAAVKNTAAANTAATNTAATPTPAPIAGHEATAYSIQLGVFSSSANVATVVSKLREHRFKVYTSPAKPVDGQPTRVLVGPNSDRQKLEKFIPRLKELTALDGRVVAYDPLSP
jgi:DedD protein